MQFAGIYIFPLRKLRFFFFCLHPLSLCHTCPEYVNSTSTHCVNYVSMLLVFVTCSCPGSWYLSFNWVITTFGSTLTWLNAWSLFLLAWPTNLTTIDRYLFHLGISHCLHTVIKLLFMWHWNYLVWKGAKICFISRLLWGYNNYLSV